MHYCGGGGPGSSLFVVMVPQVDFIAHSIEIEIFNSLEAYLLPARRQYHRLSRSY